MKRTIALIAGISLCLIASPFRLCAEDAAPTVTPSPSPVTSSPSATPGKHQHQHRDVNEWLDKHPKIKAEVLAKFDTNHNGILDGDEIKAFKKWRKEHRGEWKHNKGGSNASPSVAPVTSGTTTPAN